MARHSVIVYRNDREACHRQADLAAESWMEYVPIRMPDTICVCERLPVGAAAVLINRSHIYRDLFLPVSPKEKTWLEAIDGVRSIGDILEPTASPSPRTNDLEAARRFFNRLWWYDQVVFDTSRQAA